MKNSRRRFIRNLSLGIAGTSVGNLKLLANQSKERLGVALVGLGYYSTEILAPALQQTKNCYLAGIVTGTEWKKMQWKQQYQIPEQNCYNYQNFDLIAKNPDIDVVYIVLPTAMHKEYVIRAAQAGKHVWCEKPMAPTVADCKAMIEACEKNKVSLSLGYRLFHEPNTKKIVDLVKEKRFGNTKIVHVSVGIYDPRINGWRLQKAMGGGAALDLGVYAVKAARYATNEMPTTVFAQYQTQRHDIYKEVEEGVVFQLMFPSGAVVHGTASFGMQINYLRAQCESGWFQLEPFQAYKGITGKSSEGILDLKVDNQQALQMDNEALAILKGSPPIVSGEEGLKDIKIIEAIHKSATTGKLVQL